MRVVLLALAFFWLTAFSTMEDIRALVKEKKLEQAFRLAEQKAAVGDHDGEEALAWFYDEGKFVAEDDSKAAYWFRKAAEAGLRHSQWRLGVMLDSGEGVESDPDEAFAWFSRSAAQNYRNAFTSLGVMHALGRGTPEDFVKSRYWYVKAAKAGEAHGFYGIGMLHHFGQGVPKDDAEACAWLTIAYFNGVSQAKQPMEILVAALSEGEMRRVVKRMNDISAEFGLINPSSDTGKRDEA